MRNTSTTHTTTHVLVGDEFEVACGIDSNSNVYVRVITDEGRSRVTFSGTPDRVLALLMEMNSAVMAAGMDEVQA